MVGSTPRGALVSVVLALLAGTGAAALVGACTGPEARRAPAQGDGVTSTTRQAVLAHEQTYSGDDLDDKELILTFDDGPSAEDASGGGWQTRRISSYLKELGIKTTFFVIGGCATPMTNPLRQEEINAGSGCDEPSAGALGTLAAVVADGHLLANHTTTHRVQTGASDWQNDILFTDTFLQNYAIPYDRLYFRAPTGAWKDSYSTPTTNPQHPLYKYKGPIYWTIGGGPTTYGQNTSMAADWECWQGKEGGGSNKLSSRACAQRYLNEIHAQRKGIVLMHDAAYGDPEAASDDAVPGNTYRMLRIVMSSLLAEGGWTFKSLWDDPALQDAHPRCDRTCATCNGESATSCLSCADGRYLADGACKPCTTTCGAGSYRSAACTATADTTCTACTTCAGGSYASAACTPTADTVCATCSVCPAGKTQLSACTSMADTTCADCSTCAAGTYRVSACTAEADTVCAACATCPAGHHPTAACTATTDTVCAPDAPSGGGPDAGTSGTTPSPGGSGAGGAVADAGAADAVAGASGCGLAPDPRSSRGLPPAVALAVVALAAVVGRRRHRDRA